MTDWRDGWHSRRTRDGTQSNLFLGRTRMIDVKNPDFMRTIQRPKFGYICRW